MGYLEFETLPKALTRDSDIGKGQLGLKHLNAPFFLEMQMIKLHNHEGIDSRQLKPTATPQMIKGFRPLEREEHGVAEWTGSAASSGSVALTFANEFSEAPEVFIQAVDSTARIVTTIGTSTITGVTIYWRDTAGATHTSVNLHWLAKAR